MNHHDWERLYRQASEQDLGWVYSELDPDLDTALQETKKRGGLLDVGGGAGHQAIVLAKKGFEVTLTDVSPSALRLAEEKAKAKGLHLRCVVDDICSSGLEGPYEVIWDRGCFHVLPPSARGVFVKQMARLCSAEGRLYIKCFAVREGEKQPDSTPWRFSEEQMRRIFSPVFQIESIKRTVYQIDALQGKGPPAWFCVFRRFS